MTPIEMHSRTANFIYFAIYVGKFAEHRFKDVPVIRVRTTKRVQTIGKNAIANRNHNATPHRFGSNTIQASGKTIRDALRPGQRHSRTQPARQSANRGLDHSGKRQIHRLKQIVSGIAKDFSRIRFVSNHSRQLDRTRSTDNRDWPFDQFLSFGNGQSQFLCGSRVSLRHLFTHRLEQFVLNQIIETAISQGATQIVGEYVPSGKNELVQNLLRDLGFTAANMPGMIFAVIVGKLVGGVTALGVAMLIAPKSAAKSGAA